MAVVRASNGGLRPSSMRLIMITAISGWPTTPAVLACNRLSGNRVLAQPVTAMAVAISTTVGLRVHRSAVVITYAEQGEHFGPGQDMLTPFSDMLCAR